MTYVLSHTVMLKLARLLHEDYIVEGVSLHLNCAGKGWTALMT
jgi:hypothetical protein